MWTQATPPQQEIKGLSPLSNPTPGGFLLLKPLPEILSPLQKLLISVEQLNSPNLLFSFPPVAVELLSGIESADQHRLLDQKVKKSQHEDLQGHNQIHNQDPDYDHDQDEDEDHVPPRSHQRQLLLPPASAGSPGPWGIKLSCALSTYPPSHHMLPKRKTTS